MKPAADTFLCWLPVFAWICTGEHDWIVALKPEPRITQRGRPMTAPTDSEPHDGEPVPYGVCSEYGGQIARATGGCEWEASGRAMLAPTGNADGRVPSLQAGMNGKRADEQCSSLQIPDPRSLIPTVEFSILNSQFSTLRSPSHTVQCPQAADTGAGRRENRCPGR